MKPFLESFLLYMKSDDCEWFTCHTGKYASFIITTIYKIERKYLNLLLVIKYALIECMYVSLSKDRLLWRQIPWYSIVNSFVSYTLHGKYKISMKVYKWNTTPTNIALRCPFSLSTLDYQNNLLNKTIRKRSIQIFEKGVEKQITLTFLLNYFQP